MRCRSWDRVYRKTLRSGLQTDVVAERTVDAGMARVLLYRVLDLVFVADSAVAGDQLAEEAGEEKQYADQDGYKSHIEERLVCDVAEPQTVDLGDYFVYYQPYRNDKAYEEECDAPYSEDVHGLLAEAGEEPDSHQVEESVEEAAHSELAFTVFAFAVDHHFLAYLCETGVFCDIGYVAVHVPVDFYFLDNIAPVGFQAAVHVVQFQACDLACGEIVYF